MGSMSAMGFLMVREINTGNLVKWVRVSLRFNNVLYSGSVVCQGSNHALAIYVTFWINHYDILVNHLNIKGSLD